MVSVTLAASLAAYLPESEETKSGGRRTITLATGTWPEVVQEIRGRYRRLGDHVFDSSGELRRGILVAVIDEIDRCPARRAHLESTDNIFVFTQIAGG